MCQPLSGKVSLVTGSSRGIGAETARKLALRGSDVVLNYRSKGARAEAVAREIEGAGRKPLVLQADLTVEADVRRMMTTIQNEFSRLDILVLNASGGLEKDKPEDYAMALNYSAQINTAKLATPLIPPGGKIIFVTSHWAHFYGRKSVLPEYEVVAKSKHAGEQALRDYSAELTERGISLVIVSGDAIEGTITLRLLERKNHAFAEAFKVQLPTIGEFAEAIAQAAINASLPSGHTVFIGSIEH